MSITCTYRSGRVSDIIGGQPVFGCSHPKNRTKRAMIQRIPGVDALQCVGCPLVDDTGTHPIQIFRSVREDLVHEDGWEWVSAERMMRDVRDLLLPKLPNDLAGVAGCPRSAMIAASYLATLLHLPLYTADSKNGLTQLGHQGSRSRAYGWGRELTGRILVLEDSTFGGGSLRRLREKIGDKGVYATVYHRPKSQGEPDFYARELGAPHYFEHHWMNSGHLNGSISHPWLQAGTALDMDGLICQDPPMHDKYVAEYETWLSEAKPRWVPRVIPCKAIVTARLEKYRLVTENWLRCHGAKYDRLIMRDVSDYTLRGDTDAWKAEVLRELGVSAYGESSPRHAAAIHELWGGVVVCPAAEKVWPPNFEIYQVSQDTASRRMEESSRSGGSYVEGQDKVNG
jgi:hypothetical protein